MALYGSNEQRCDSPCAQLGATIYITVYIIVTVPQTTHVSCYSIVGFINPGSLMDRLPCKGSAQQTNAANVRTVLGPAQVLKW